MSQIQFQDPNQAPAPTLEEQYQAQQEKGIHAEASAAEGEGEDQTVQVGGQLEIKPEQPKEEENTEQNQEEKEKAPDKEPENREEAEKALASSSLNIEDFENEFAAQGYLSDDSYAKLEKAGFKRDMVDRYIQASAIISDNMISSIQGIVGGKEQYQKMCEWAVENLPASEIEAFNNIVTQSKDINLIRLAVENLGYKYKQANGSKPARTIHGQTSASASTYQGFRSSAEMVQAMRDPRYGKDPAYTRDVERKTALSDF